MAATTIEPGVYVYGTACLPRFDNAAISIAREQDGITQWFPISATCTILGLDAAAQRRAINNDDVLGAWVRDVPFKTPPGWRMTACLPRKEYVRWLTLMDPRRIGLKARERLREFQDDVLAEADRLFFHPRGHVAQGERGPAAATFTARVEIRQPCPDCGTPLLAVYENGDGYIVHDRED